jgi:hypothetical protein
MKRCSTCREEKERDQFHKDCTAKDGLQTSCKICKNAKCRQKYAENPEWAEKRRLKNSLFHKIRRDSIAERKKSYYESDHGKMLHREHSRAWKSRNKDKIRAHAAVERALKRGIIVKPKYCTNCASSRRLEAHHQDYTKLLDVTWLCKLCHESVTIKKHSVKSEMET